MAELCRASAMMGPRKVPEEGVPPETFYVLREDGGRAEREDGTGFVLRESAP